MKMHLKQLLLLAIAVATLALGACVQTVEPEHRVGTATYVPEDSTIIYHQ